MPRLILLSACWLYTVCFLYGCQGNRTMTGENLWATGGPQTVSAVPQGAMVIGVSDDGTCRIENQWFASLEEAIEWCRQDAEVRADAVLMAASKRVPSERLIPP